MGFTSAGLPNGGRTAHYEISFDQAFAGNIGLNLATGLMGQCEKDFALMAEWFAGVNFEFSFPLPVQIVNASGGASWTDPPNFVLPFGASPTVTINALNPPAATSVDFLRYLLVSEVTEMFMASQSKGWFENTSLFSGADEGSRGEGLSRFLGVELKVANGQPPIPPPNFKIVPLWLNGGRPDFINADPDDHNPDPTTGCTTCFIYYLHYQLGLGISEIIGAGASNMAGVYQNLTGATDAWAVFSALVNSHYPPTSNYNPVGDNIFPVPELNQFYAPNQITCGYSEFSQVFIDKPAMAEVNIQLISDNPALVSVPARVTIPVGGTAATVTFHAPAIAGPFPMKTTNIHARYAGKTVTISVDVVPPRIVSLTLAPDTVICGDSSTATVTLDRASLAGPVVVDLVCGSPGFATVPAQVTIPQNAISTEFTVTTPDIKIAFKTAHATIYASYSASNAPAMLTVKSRVVAGILNTLTIFPTTVTAGGTSRGTVTLIEAVPTPTVVGLAATDTPATGGLGGIPLPGSGTSVASVPSKITIPAGHTTGLFTITTHQNVAPNTRRKVTITAGAIAFKYAALTVEG